LSLCGRVNYLMSGLGALDDLWQKADEGGVVLPSLNLGALPLKVYSVDVHGGILSVVCSRTTGSSS
jgi:hypothetical protein